MYLPLGTAFAISHSCVLIYFIFFNLEIQLMCFNCLNSKYWYLTALSGLIALILLCSERTLYISIFFKFKVVLTTPNVLLMNAEHDFTLTLLLLG